jgi:hypothetical protein
LARRRFLGPRGSQDPLTGQRSWQPDPIARINHVAEDPGPFLAAGELQRHHHVASQNYREVKEHYDPFRLWSLRADHQFSSKSFITATSTARTPMYPLSKQPAHRQTG